MKALIWAIAIMLLVSGGISGVPNADATKCTNSGDSCN